jgi:hypothetical protein
MVGPKGKEGAWRLPQEIPPPEVASDTALMRRMDAFTRMAVAFQTGDQAGFDAAATELSRNELLTDSLSALGDGSLQRIRESNIRAELGLGQDPSLPHRLDRAHDRLPLLLDRRNHAEGIAAEPRAGPHGSRESAPGPACSS